MLAINHLSNISFAVGCQWLTPISLATQEAKIRRTEVRSQPRQIVCETLSQKYPSQKRAGGMAQVTEWPA
jgi:hypothetical protein